MKIKFLVFCIFLWLPVSCSADIKSQYPVVQIGDNTLAVEIADTPEKRNKGLMHRTSLDGDKGMLFIYEREQHVPFWMKDTGIPLSIAFINRAGTITEIRDLEPYSTKMIWSSYPVLYALEVNLGYFEKNGIKTGDLVKLPDSK